jgi:hypothetical protein
VEPERPWDALQLHGTDLGERHRPSVGRVDNLLAHQHLARSGVLGDPRRQVHRPAEVVTVLEHHRPRMDGELVASMPGIDCYVTNSLTWSFFRMDALGDAGWRGWLLGVLKAFVRSRSRPAAQPSDDDRA